MAERLRVHRTRRGPGSSESVVGPRELWIAPARRYVNTHETETHTGSNVLRAVKTLMSVPVYYRRHYRKLENRRRFSSFSLCIFTSGQRTYLMMSFICNVHIIIILCGGGDVEHIRQTSCLHALSVLMRLCNTQQNLFPRCRSGDIRFLQGDDSEQIINVHIYMYCILFLLISNNFCQTAIIIIRIHVKTHIIMFLNTSR